MMAESERCRFVRGRSGLRSFLACAVLLYSFALAFCFSGNDVTVSAAGDVLVGFDVEPHERARSFCVQLGAAFSAASRASLAFEFSRLHTYSKGSFWRTDPTATKQEPGAPHFSGRVGEVLYKYAYNATLYTDASCKAVAVLPFARRPGGACEGVYCGPGAACPPGADAGNGVWNYTRADWQQVTIGPYYACPGPAGDLAAAWDAVRALRVTVFLAHAPPDVEFALRDPARPAAVALALGGVLRLAGMALLLAACGLLPVVAFGFKGVQRRLADLEEAWLHAGPWPPDEDDDGDLRGLPDGCGRPDFAGLPGAADDGIAAEERSPDGATVSRPAQADEYGAASGGSSAVTSVRRFRLALGAEGLELHLAEGDPAAPMPPASAYAPPGAAARYAPRAGYDPTAGYDPGQGYEYEGGYAQPLEDDWQAAAAADAYGGYAPPTEALPPEPAAPPPAAAGRYGATRVPAGYDEPPPPAAGRYGAAAVPPAYGEPAFAPAPAAYGAGQAPAPGPADWPEY